MGDRVWHLPREQFITIWNGAATLAEAAERVKLAVGGNAPRWAVMSRAGALRKEGVELKVLGVPSGRLEAGERSAAIKSPPR